MEDKQTNDRKFSREGILPNSNLKQCSHLMSNYCVEKNYKIKMIEEIPYELVSHIIGNPPDEEFLFEITFFQSYPAKKTTGEISFLVDDISNDEFNMLNEFLTRAT